MKKLALADYQLSRQHRFYILIATLILSNFGTKIVYALSGYCDTDTTRTCYTCNPGTPGTMDAKRYEELIDGECSDYNNGDEVWCKTYSSHTGGAIIQHNGSAYICADNGWEITTVGSDDIPVSCNAGYYAKTQTGPCVRCPTANFYWAEYEDDIYIPLENAEATSKGGTSDIYSCYIQASSGYYNLYMDNAGVFSLTKNCYYGS